MKKILSLILAAALLLAALPAGAEELPGWFAAAERLLFDTDNVTLRGRAVFTLDGVRIKTAEAEYRQDGFNSYWQLKLFTPREEGEDRESGYTIILYDGVCYVMEAFYPGVYRSQYLYTDGQNTPVRRTVANQELAKLTSMLIAQAEKEMPVTALMSTDVPGEERSIAVNLKEGEVPELLNAAVDLAAQYVLRRYFHVTHDTTFDSATSSYDYFITPVEGIKYTTRSVSLLSTSFAMTMDGKERLTSVKGSAAFDLKPISGESRRLDVEFDMAATDYKATGVFRFDPDEYGVKPADEDQFEIPMGAMTDSEAAPFLAKAREAWLAAGYPESDMEKTSIFTMGEEEPVVYVSLYGGERELFTLMDMDCGIMLMSDQLSVWLDDDTFSTEDFDEAKVAEYKQLVLDFLKAVRPGDLTEGAELVPSAEGWNEATGDSFLCFDLLPADDVMDGGSVVLQLAPVTRVVYLNFLAADG